MIRFFGFAFLILEENVLFLVAWLLHLSSSTAAPPGTVYSTCDLAFQSNQKRGVNDSVFNLITLFQKRSVIIS